MSWKVLPRADAACGAGEPNGEAVSKFEKSSMSDVGGRK